jgi:SAM-dependent methyltransferase
MTTKRVEVRISGDEVRKTELAPDPLKKNSVAAEAEIIRALNGKKCPCVPLLIDAGTDSKGRAYLLTRLVKGATNAPLADFWLSYLAVRGCGWEHGDLMSRHALFDGTMARLIDFDQAFPATAESRWKDGHVDKGLAREFAKIAVGRFDLGSTALAKKGISTAGHGGIYHSLHEKAGGQEIFIQGERGIGGRTWALMNIDFRGESVLDVGCNTGSVARWIGREGKASSVTGIERCAEHALLGQMINCALGLHHIEIMPGSVGETDVPSGFDTVLLFSVFHHIVNAKAAAAAILGTGAKRILIETKPAETGSSFRSGRWNRSGGWKLHSWEALHAHLEAIFPGFRFNRNYGESDRGRRILEMVRI